MWGVCFYSAQYPSCVVLSGGGQGLLCFACCLTLCPASPAGLLHNVNGKLVCPLGTSLNMEETKHSMAAIARRQHNGSGSRAAADFSDMRSAKLPSLHLRRAQERIPEKWINCMVTKTRLIHN